MSVEDLIFWSLVISVAAMDIGKTRVFRPLRDWFGSRAFWLGKLVSCPWCLAHWLALVVCLIMWINPLWTFVLVMTASLPMLVASCLFKLLDGMGD